MKSVGTSSWGTLDVQATATVDEPEKRNQPVNLWSTVFIPDARASGDPARWYRVTTGEFCYHPEPYRLMRYRTGSHRVRVLTRVRNVTFNFFVASSTLCYLWHSVELQFRQYVKYIIHDMLSTMCLCTLFFVRRWADFTYQVNNSLEWRWGNQRVKFLSIL